VSWEWWRATGPRSRSLRGPVKRAIPALLAAAAIAALPAGASARVIESGSVLPPGQSGFVSAGGVADGTGSPHLNDQTDLFVNFKFKPATFNLPGETETPRAGVKIVRDKYGVPAITGDTIDDAWWGAGYAMAQDRLFQIEIFRRAAQGRLSEVLGKSYVPMDVETRRDFPTPGEADQQLARLPSAVQGYFRDYRDGVNAWIAKARNDPSKLPGEYTALGIGMPQDFTLTDSAMIGIYLARTIPSGTGEELSNLAAFQGIGAKAFDRILPLHTTHNVITVPRANGLFPSNPGRTRKQERAAWKRSQPFAKSLPLPSEGERGTIREDSQMPLLGHVGKPEGSDVWAIRGPKHKAALFTGPQLGYSIPELLVELEVNAPGFHARGVSAAGVPVVGIGHNEHVAWGLTSGESDDDDLYAEKLVDAEHYRYKGKTVAMSCRNETFTWKPPPTDALDPTGLLGGLVPGSGGSGGGDPATPAGSQTERICRTVHGPVQARAGDVAYARRFAIFGREAETINGLLDLDRAKSIKDVDRAMRKVTWNENTTAADDKGHIGYWHPGLLPWKPKGWDERLPYPGDGRAEWKGFLPVKRRPHVIDPKQGYLFNWNNKPSAAWTEGDTYARQRVQGPLHHAAYLGRQVRRVALERKKFGLLHTASVDRFSGTISEQRPVATKLLKRAAKPAHGAAKTVLDTILAWDGSFARVGSDGKIDAGAAAWQELKAAAMKRALGRYGKSAELLGATRSEDFDATNGETYGLTHLNGAGLRGAAKAASVALNARFGSTDPAAWRQPRPMTETTSMGAGSFPPFPLFDRGTWQQVALLGR
jgi:penicillin amidase